ncbi:Cytochrome c oxidase subunit 1 [bacterium HR39]|nr:Cytochrome c oxidase subunit 1 [bacterium HR39]
MLAALVFLLLMVFGLLMRAAQGGLVALAPDLFYRILTVHGAGMVGTAGLSGAAIMWFFVNRHVPLSHAVYVAFLALFLAGVVSILGAVFAGGFAGAWTFLYPLPAVSGGAWDPLAAVVFLLGYVAIGVGFLLLHLDIGRALISAWGSIPRALGWPLVFGRGGEAPPPTVIAAMAVTIFNTIGIVVGAAVLISSIVNLVFPGFAVDALLAKNMIYFFGHVFINASIYMAVIAVYEIVPEYTGMPWKATRLFAATWSVVLLFVMAVYPHHLLQDVPLPGWTMVVGQVLSYYSGIPVIAVTAWSLLVYLRRAQSLAWDLPLALLVLGVAGWSAGVVPAVIDAIVAVNRVMHNTLWVPGHFHTYLLLGEVAMAFGFLLRLAAGERFRSFTGFDRTALVLYLAGGIGLVLTFLISGAASIPRRFAVHLPDWQPLALIGAVAASLTVAGALLVVLRALSSPRAREAA